MKKVGSQEYLISKIKLSPELLFVQPDMEISNEDYQNIKLSISEDGLKDPLRGYFGEDRFFFVLSGANRLQACTELGKETIDIQVYEGGTWAERVKFCISENLARRHFTTEQKRKLVSRMLKLDPALSNRALASSVGVDDKTVASVRNELVTGAEIPHLTARKGKDGKIQKAQKSNITKAEINSKSKNVNQINALKREIKALKSEIKKKQSELRRKEVHLNNLL